MCAGSGGAIRAVRLPAMWVRWQCVGLVGTGVVGAGHRGLTARSGGELTCQVTRQQQCSGLGKCCCSIYGAAAAATDAAADGALRWSGAPRLSSCWGLITLGALCSLDGCPVLVRVGYYWVEFGGSRLPGCRASSVGALGERSYIVSVLPGY